MTIAFSDQLHNVLIGMQKGQWSKGQAFFPAQIEGRDIRVHPGETPHNWFNRCVHEVLEDETEVCAIEDNLAIFLVLAGDKKRFSSIHCQAFAVLDGGLLDAFAGDAKEVRYLRLDYDKEEIGDLFSHPYPHVHFGAGDAPRFPMIPFSDECALIDFLETLYLNFCHRAWMAWAKSVLKDQASILEDVANKIRDEKTLRKADFLQARSKEMAPLLMRLQQAKRDMPFSLPLNLGDLSNINYSCLRGR